MGFLIVFPMIITMLTVYSLNPHPKKVKPICHQEVVRVYLYDDCQVVGFQDRGVKVCEKVD